MGHSFQLIEHHDRPAVGEYLDGIDGVISVYDLYA
jgi:hypothetical protein